jgi:hypothetical protein
LPLSAPRLRWGGMKEQLLDLFDRLTDTHALLIALQSRDKAAFPLPGNADELLDACENELSKARDDLMALASTTHDN